MVRQVSHIYGDGIMRQQTRVRLISCKAENRWAPAHRQIMEKPTEVAGLLALPLFIFLQKTNNFKNNLTVNLVDALYFKRNDNYVTGGHNMEVLVQTHNLTKQYGQHKAVSNVNLSVIKGEIYGLIGRNGAGKTTVLRLISRLAKPTEGDICLFGQNSHDTGCSQNRVGILIENPGVYPNMSAKDNVKLKCLAMGISSKGYIAELLEDVGLSANDKKNVLHS